MVKKLAVFLVVLALVMAGAFLVRAKKASLAAAPAPTARPTPVRVAEAVRGTLDDTRTYLARIEPWQSADLSAQVAMRVLRVQVREGDAVRRGEVLVTLDDAELRSSLEQAEATLASLEQTLSYWRREQERDAMLAREGAIARAVAEATADRLNEARGKVEAQRKRRDELMTRLAYTRIVSPFDGVVAACLCDPGDLAAPGKVMLSVEDRSRLKVVFAVPQGEADQVKPGTPIMPDGADVASALRVDRVYPSLNADRTRTVEAYAEPAGMLSPGAYLPVQLTLARMDEAVIVPEEALLTTPKGETAVLAVKDGHLEPIAVTVRLIRDGRVAVDGLKPGTRVVRSTYLGWNRLAGGEPVEVVQ